MVEYGRQALRFDTFTQRGMDRYPKENTMSPAAASPTRLTKLKSREEVAEQTMAFRFEKPSGFTFMPGQCIDLTLVNPPKTDAEGDGRTFSIASAPYEDFLMVATRLRDTAFKQVLKSLPLGTEVKIEGPSGDLKLHHDKSRAAVVLTGGIGITPFRSILLNAAKEKLAIPIFLFYGNKRPEDAVFFDELQELKEQNPHYKLIACMSEMEKSHRSWKGERGMIDAQMLAKYLQGVLAPIYYITGPPGMVKAMQTILKDTGVDDNSIRTEEFAGY
jgi:ferredoxin-NADP reductase